MNNTFSFERFLKVLKYDLKMRVPAVGTMFLVFLAMPHALHLLMDSGNSFPVLQRVDLYVVMGMMLIFFAPFSIYSSFKDKHGRASFLMLPASAFEKFASMVLVSLVLLPVSSLLCTYILDAVLVLLFRGIYVSVVTIDTITLARGFVGVFAIVGSALLGNSLFRKKASFKTILCILAITFIWGAGLTDYIFSDMLSDGNVDSAVLEMKAEQIKNITAAVFFTVAVLFYILACWRIKKIQIS